MARMSAVSSLVAGAAVVDSGAWCDVGVCIVVWLAAWSGVCTRVDAARANGKRGDETDSAVDTSRRAARMAVRRSRTRWLCCVACSCLVCACVRVRCVVRRGRVVAPVAVGAARNRRRVQLQTCTDDPARHATRTDRTHRPRAEAAWQVRAGSLPRDAMSTPTLRIQVVPRACLVPVTELLFVQDATALLAGRHARHALRTIGRPTHSGPAFLTRMTVVSCTFSSSQRLVRV